MKETNKLEDTVNNFPYSDILYLEHPISNKHPRMPISTRAGQFSPFAALTGYDDEICEIERITEDEKILDESEKEILDEKIKYIINCNEKIDVKIIYFEKDTKKSGGIYKEVFGKIKRIDHYKNEIIMENKMRIKIKNIVNILIFYNDKEIFDKDINYR